MTLVVGLLLLLVITIIGIAASNDTVTYSKVVSSSKDKQMSFAYAESALRTAGDSFQNNVPPPECADAAGNLAAGYINSQPTGQWWKTYAWESGADGSATTGAARVATMDGARGKAGYVIEAPKPGRGPDVTPNVASDASEEWFYYQVTAKGEGPAAAQTYLKSVYILKQNEDTRC